MTKNKLHTIIENLKLKVKAKSLAVEAKIIKQEERTLLRTMKYQCPEILGNLHYEGYALYRHRVSDVRKEARATHLARAFIADKPYSSVEKTRKDEKEVEFVHYIKPRVHALVKKYGRDKMKSYWAEDADETSYASKKEQVDERLSTALAKWLDV